jgi:hypothetical protein
MIVIILKIFFVLFQIVMICEGLIKLNTFFKRYLKSYIKV